MRRRITDDDLVDKELLKATNHYHKLFESIALKDFVKSPL
jgi:hypothetical protein